MNRKIEIEERLSKSMDTIPDDEGDVINYKENQPKTSNFFNPVTSVHTYGASTQFGLSKLIRPKIENQEDEIQSISILLDDIELNSSEKTKISEKNIHDTLNKSKAMKNWGVLVNVTKIVHRFRNIPVKNIDTLRDFNSFEVRMKFKTENINNDIQVINTNLTPKYNNKYKVKNQKDIDTLEFIYKQSRLFKFLQEGKDSHEKEIFQLINDDPNKFLYAKNQDYKYFINQQNEEFLTPLYVTTVNGHLKYVKMLVESGANHLIRIGKDCKGESVLCTSVRWKHKNITDFYLKLSWPKEHLNEALKLCRSLKDKENGNKIDTKLKKLKEKNICNC